LLCCSVISQSGNVKIADRSYVDIVVRLGTHRAHLVEADMGTTSNRAGRSPEAGGRSHYSKTAMFYSV